MENPVVVKKKKTQSSVVEAENGGKSHLLVYRVLKSRS